MSELRRWLTELSLEQHFDAFVKEGIDLDIVADLSDPELERLGLSLGQRKRLLRAAAALRGTPRQMAPADSNAASLSEAPARAERRQVTVLFCDLVASTQLAEMLGEESFSDVIRAYQQMCTAAVQRFDGHVARYMGDGVLVYFGFPQAHEDDPQRAVRAALAMLEETVTLNRRVAAAYGASAAVRIGIHTGPVVAGDLGASGSPSEISGVTPNIAARLQTLAAPNTIVVGPLTRELLYDHFDCTALGPTELKGVSQPLALFRVDGERAVESRFSARATGRLTPLVGREPELSLLLERWERAIRGDGEVVVLSGEPGIGKSRLVQSLRQHIGEGAARQLSFQCSPYHGGSAFHPFIERLERLAKWPRDETPERKLDRMEEVLAADGTDVADAAPLIASMLMIPTGSRYALPEMSPRQLRDRTIEALVAQVIAASKHRPVLLVFEDAHWADPTSLEVLGAIAIQAEHARVMAVVTCRPGGAPPLPGVRVSNLVLNRLSKRERRELALKIAGGHRLPESILGQIIDRTDGVPLFVEELTRTVMEADAAAGDRDADSPAPALTLPPTLQDSLMARLDRLPAGKEVAQIGAVIGREFSYDVLAALAPMPGPELRGALNALVESEIIVPRGPTERAGYSFRHALVQEAAYHSLLSGRRRELHGETAKVLDATVPGLSASQPEIIAHHYTEAGNIAKAVGYWLEAGRSAGARSANAEAVQSLTVGLKLIERLPETAERNQQELDFLIALGPALINTRGPGVPEVERTYARAVALCARMPVAPKHFAVYWGQWRISRTFEIKRARADELHAVAEKLDEPGFLLQAHHAEWATLFVLGDQAACCERIDKGLALYDAGDYRWHASIYGGHDAKVCGLGEAGLALWLRGFPDRAVAQANRALAWSRELNHAGSRAHALDYALMLHWFRRDAASMAPLAAELIDLADRQRFVDYQARARVFRGWARVRRGEIAAGLDDMRAGVDDQRSTATKEDLPIFLDMLAQGYADTPETQLELVSEALTHARGYGVRHWLAELYRRHGELVLAVAGGDGDSGRPHLEMASQIASDQGTRSLQLRAATSLARHAQRWGRHDDALTDLASLCDAFVEGLDTADVIEARNLRAALEAAAARL